MRSSSFATWSLSLLFAALVAPGCGGVPEEAWDEERAIGEAEQATQVCAAGETVEGIDVSFWQGDIDWSAVPSSGVKFAITRVSYGTSLDTKFDANWAGMKSAGLVRGAYQFFLPDQDPVAQADLMLSAMGPLGAGDLPPVIDVEDTGGLSPAGVADKVGQWIAHVEAAIGRKPIIYSGKYFWQDNVKSTAFGDVPLWIPNYSYSCPDMPDAYWSDWAFFQYTDSGSVSGIGGNVDRDLFNGSLDDLLAFASGGASYAAAFVEQSFPYASEGAITMHAGEATEAWITLRNTGTKAWDGSTKLATTEPRDRESPFAGPEWEGPNRYARVEGTVAPGEEYTFTFLLHGPVDPGSYDEHFGLVQEGVAWFSDAGQGGPPDAQLEALITVLPAEGGAGGAGGDTSSSTTTGVTGDVTSGGGDDAFVAGQTDSSGGCGVASRGAGAWPGLGAVAVAALLGARRRRRPIAG